MARPRWLTRFSRVPIRARLTIASVAMMATVLAIAGVFLYAQFRSTLDAQIGDALHLQAADVGALVARGHSDAIASRGNPLTVGCRVGGCLAQVYRADGRLLASTAQAGAPRLLTPAQAGRAARRTQQFEFNAAPLGAVRVLAVPAHAPHDDGLAVAVADSVAPRDTELARLRTLLLIAGPVALLLAGIGGNELARAALRPVDRMRSRAERITERQLAERLPVSEAGDEIGALGRTLNAMLDRVEAAVAHERRVVSDASHELRTPLTTLRAEVDLALLGDRQKAELRAALESASQEAKRMSRLADDLLVLARADQGRLPLQPQPLAARELLEDAAGRARAGMEVRGRSITIGDVPAGCAVRADPDRSAQALDNLITNALLYGEGTITLSARGDREQVELHVTDEGHGFPDDLIPRAFERFGRGQHARGDQPGSGLGLALVEAVAVAHGGHAEVRNRPDGGADVSIALPRA
ncbi:MAG: integral rane sensor signal transduction histidine kinase [Solirubrobacterales bacterium]|nr:integral rane sensor signal transduction histidine kinase [Solirubrobacterales bacterium]